VIENLGFYDVSTDMPLLLDMSTLSYAVLLLGIVFDVIVILLIAISVLLIYSLLMISVETKTFEHGVLRMVGISQLDCCSVIFYQSVTFIVPSLISSYVLSIPANYLIYKWLFTPEMGI
jgi:ABC-type antimicrobial peptide transport system permease subunit